MPMRTYKYLLRPKSDQRALLERLLEQHRYAYNLALEQRRDAWNNEQHNPTPAEQSRYFLAMRYEHPEPLGLAGAYSEPYGG